MTPQSEKKPNINPWDTFLTEGAPKIKLLIRLRAVILPLFINIDKEPLFAAGFYPARR